MAAQLDLEDVFTQRSKHESFDFLCLRLREMGIRCILLDEPPVYETLIHDLIALPYFSIIAIVTIRPSVYFHLWRNSRTSSYEMELPPPRYEDLREIILGLPRLSHLSKLSRSAREKIVEKIMKENIPEAKWETLHIPRPFDMAERIIDEILKTIPSKDA
jgi:hypothetical protein